jgi:hypothetical protein
MSRRPRPCLGARGSRCGASTRNASGRCDKCHHAERGTTAERGYGTEHRKLREHWAEQVATGTVRCAKPGCGQLIQPGEPWDLGHAPDRSYPRPEHQACNRATHGALSESCKPRSPAPEPPRLVIPF